MTRESLDFDVVIVGAGPSGLSAACRLGQLSKQKNLNLSIAVVEKGAEVGSHIVSGAVIDPEHFSIGFKEVWTVSDARHRPGHVDHTFGWPLDRRTHGGGFLYHAADNRSTSASSWH